MILITGAAGKTGIAILHALAGKGETVRGMVRRSDQVGKIEEAGATAVVGDFHNRDSLSAAMQGVRAVYHICPNVHPDEVMIGETVLRIAKESGVQHFVFHSVLHPQVESMPHHWKKMHVEEKIFKSGLEYTILQPAAYMQNMLAQWNSMLQDKVYHVPYRAEARLSIVDLEDVAQAAATVLTTPGHANAIYELCGPQALSQNELVQIVGGVIGREVQVDQTPLEVWERNAANMPVYARETLLQMFRYYDRYGLVGNPNGLRILLGREPTRFEDFVRRTANLLTK